MPRHGAGVDVSVWVQGVVVVRREEFASAPLSPAPRRARSCPRPSRSASASSAGGVKGVVERVATPVDGEGGRFLCRVGGFTAFGNDSSRWRRLSKRSSEHWISGYPGSDNVVCGRRAKELEVLTSEPTTGKAELGIQAEGSRLLFPPSIGGRTDRGQATQHVAGAALSCGWDISWEIAVNNASFIPCQLESAQCECTDRPCRRECARLCPEPMRLLPPSDPTAWHVGATRSKLPGLPFSRSSTSAPNGCRRRGQPPMSRLAGSPTI